MPALQHGGNDGGLLARLRDIGGVAVRWHFGIPDRRQLRQKVPVMVHEGVRDPLHVCRLVAEGRQRIAAGPHRAVEDLAHLMLRPGAERIARLGGLHRFMNWDRPILTDSGGFQVMSLADLRKLTEAGVTFRSHVDGSVHHLSPETSMEIQRLLGSDIVMAFDECPALPATDAAVASSMRLSMRWAERSKAAFGDRPGHALFGIMQGGVTQELREESAEALKAIGFDGYAIGGLAVGEPEHERRRWFVLHGCACSRSGRHVQCHRFIRHQRPREAIHPGVDHRVDEIRGDSGRTQFVGQ